VKAVEDVTIRIEDGQIVGLVGESGSGKSTLGRIMVHLLEPTRGDVLFDIPDDVLGEYEDARATGDQEALGRIRATHSLTYRQRPALGWRPLLRWALGLILGGTLGAVLPALAIAFSSPPFANLPSDFLWAATGGVLVGFFAIFFTPEAPRFVRDLVAGVALIALNIGVGLAVALNGAMVSSRSYDSFGAFATGYQNGGVGLVIAILVGSAVAWQAANTAPVYLLRAKGKEADVMRMRRIRRQMNIVLQDPYSSLNPRMKLVDVISEPMLSMHYATREEARLRALELLQEVGLPEVFGDRYPHELSGGQRQRVAIARAISTNPKFLVLDEPTSALDVSVQAQILGLLRNLRDKYRISMLLITHNIAVISYLAEKVYVMYAGKVMEWGDVAKVLREPEHPYTKALMSAVPIAGQRRNRILLRGDPPNLVFPPAGCRFHPRCPVAFNACGWTADEVQEDLGYLFAGKYYPALGPNLIVQAEDDRTVSVQGTTNIEGIRSLVEREREDIRSLQAVQSVDQASDRIVLRLSETVEPGLYPRPTGGEVKCLLFRPGAEAPPVGAAG